ncbi:hypothetical protein LSM04_005337 [Trypanosoma melophagium]|uniref:uncharacterized protein n=1 Tax=Trypanosoma melophagium TaxID=715481 RepID=UPI00351A5EFA|nr:hypothetical protein LSM04_005337 [Trypanosoma melophagium]
MPGSIVSEMSRSISGESAQTVVETTPNKQKEEKNSSPSTPVGISNSQQSNPTTQEHDAGTQGTEEKGKKPASRKRRSTEHADATTSPSTPKPNNTENTIQSQSTVIGTDDLSSQTIFDGSVNGKKLTGGQIKEESKNTNIMVMVAPDSSIAASYMVPLAFLVCAIGFVMVP